MNESTTSYQRIGGYNTVTAIWETGVLKNNRETSLIGDMLISLDIE
jgi:hypothetical protein